MLLLHSCATTTAVDGPKNELRGTVRLRDTHGLPISNASGVLVTAEGSGLSATSDSNGNWVIPDLPASTYTLHFTKTDCGTYTNTAFTFDATAPTQYPDTVTLYQELKCRVVLDSVTAIYDSVFSLLRDEGFESGRVLDVSLADSTAIQVIVLFSYSPTIPLHDTLHAIGGSRFTNPSVTEYPLTREDDHLRFHYDQWEVCGPTGWMQHDRTVYLQAFVLPRSGEPFYLDPVNGTRVYPNKVPASNIVAVKIP
jgi:hypothetical protein